MGKEIILRKYRPADCGELAALFYDTVHTVNAGDYTEEQLCAWAPGGMDLKEWDRSFREHDCIVAIMDGRLAGFGDTDGNGYFDRLFVHKDYQGKGVATAICGRLEQAVPGKMVTCCASITANPFFEKRGYQVIREQQITRRGISLTNFVMEKEG